MSDRLTGFIVLVVALAFFASATQLEMPFFSDPVGPKTFPMLVSGLAIISALFLVLRPDQEPEWPVLGTFVKLLIATIILILYAYLLKPLGFLIPTALNASALSYQIKPDIKLSIITGICLSIGLFIIFRFGFGLGLSAFPRWLIG